VTLHNLSHSRRIAYRPSQPSLPGPPLSQTNAAGLLLSHNVTIGIGVQEQWQSRNIRFDVGWTALDAGGYISKTQAIALASTNLEKLLGLKNANMDLVATRASGLHDFEGEVVVVISPREGGVNFV